MRPAGFTLASLRCNEACPDQDLSAWKCSLPLGHPGDHAAHPEHDLSAGPFFTWPCPDPTEVVADLEACLETLQDMK